MEMKAVGATGLGLSAVGLGAVEFCAGDASRGEPTLREASAAVAAAIESGVNWIDTACCRRACEWLPDGHLAWFVIDAVAALDLKPFYRAYRDNGQGRAAHDPAMMVALLLYSYVLGERSSRRIERRCVEDVATRVICANRGLALGANATGISA